MTTAVQVQYRRGTSTQVASFTGAAGEMVIDTTNNRVVVQDASTAGGWPAAKLAEVLTNTRTAISDANYAALSTDRTVAYAAITAARTVSLPASSSYPTGTRLLVVDESGSCSASLTIMLSASGTDVIDGAATAAINSAYGYLAIESSGSGKWTIIDQPGGGSSGGVSSVNALTGALSIAATDGLKIAALGSTVSIGGPGGLVNRFRNGTMDVWQRGTSSLTATTSGNYAADGWIVLPTGASVTCSQVTNNRTGALSLYALKMLGATSVTDVIVKQRIESYVAAPLAGQVVTVQAEVYNSTGGSITPTLTVKHATSQDSWGSSTTDASAVNLQACANAAWTKVAYSFTASSSSGNGLEVAFDFGNNFGSGSNYVYIAELDIRVTPGAAGGATNSSPPPPELRPIFAEQPFCQRYYYRRPANPNATYTSTGGYDIICVVQAYSASGAFGKLVDLPVTMRAAPTVNVSNIGHFSMWNPGGTSVSAFSGGASAFLTTPYTISNNGFTGASGSSAGDASQLVFNTSSGWFDGSAEL
jgi:hypothetical protein